MNPSKKTKGPNGPIKGGATVPGNKDVMGKEEVIFSSPLSLTKKCTVQQTPTAN
jgi:hypothetical protein